MLRAEHGSLMVAKFWPCSEYRSDEARRANRAGETGAESQAVDRRVFDAAVVGEYTASRRRCTPQ